MDIILYICIFFSGYLTALFLSHLLSLGYSIMIFKQSVVDCLTMLGNASQKVREFNELNYFAMRKQGKNEGEVQIVEKYDKMQINSMQNILIRNLISKIPDRFSSICDFHDWDSAMEYLKTERK